MEKKDYLIKDSIILFAATSIVNLSNFIFHMYVSRSLGPEKYGVVVTLLALVIVIVMPSLALQMTIAKRASILKAREKFGSVEHLYKKTSAWFLALGIAYFIIFTLGSGIFQEFFHIKDRMLLIILGLISVIALVLPVIRGILQGLQNFIGFGSNLIIEALLRLGFVVLLITMGWGIRGAIATTLFSNIIAYIAGFVLIAFLFKYKDDDVEVVSKGELFSYALPVFLSMLGFALISYMDVFMVKHFHDEHSAGLYSATSIIGKAFLFFPSAIALALFPKVSENYELKKNTRGLLVKSLLLTAGISAVGVVLCFFFPRLVIGLLFGQKYFGIDYIVRIFGVAIMPVVLINVIMNYALAVHKYKFIYVMYAGIVLYGVLLWFFHSDFYQVLAVLFSVNLLILVASMFVTWKEKRKEPEKQ